jgi:hypothetical protein
LKKAKWTASVPTSPPPLTSRAVVASHHNLEQLIEAVRFDATSIIASLSSPSNSLRCESGRENLPALVDHFVRQVTAQNGWKPVSFNPKAIQALQRYSGPATFANCPTSSIASCCSPTAKSMRASVATALPAIQHSACRDTGASLTGASSSTRPTRPRV